VNSTKTKKIQRKQRKTVDKYVGMWYIVYRVMTKFGFLMILSVHLNKYQGFDL